MMRHIRALKQRREEQGFVLVFVAIGMVAFVLAIGLAVDLGSWYLRASKLQRAADSAALAAATALPNTTLAAANADAAYLRNGFVNGQDNITIVNETELESFSTSIDDAHVETFFTRMLFNNITLDRESFAKRAASGPEIGSPFNVLGTGDLSIPGQSQPQNYWLAMNGPCSPREDGDYFGALREGSKGPFATTQDANRNYQGPSGYHSCSNGVPNPNYQQAPYSYFIDVPPSSVASGDIEVRIYDPAFNYRQAGDSASDTYPDVGISLGGDTVYMDWSPAYDLLDTNGTPEDPTDDTSLLAHPQSTSVHDGRHRNLLHREWWHLGTIKAADIGPDGGQFRVQLILDNDGLDTTDRGINSFSIGAFPTWKAPLSACDSRDDPTCPKVYGRSAISVNTQLQGASGQEVEFFFAKIDPAYVGQSFDVQMWDPGEGVAKIELLMPNGEPLRFNWSTFPSAGPAYSGSNVTSVETGGTGPPPPGFSLSNDYKFNGRLLTLQVVIPSEYANVVNSTGSDWLRLRYTIGTAASDRTTWGIAATGSNSGNPHLIRNPNG